MDLRFLASQLLCAFILHSNLGRKQLFVPSFKNPDVWSDCLLVEHLSANPLTSTATKP